MNKSDLVLGIKVAVITVIVFIVLNTFFISNIQIPDNTMSPVLEKGERAISSRIEKIDRFDVISFHNNQNDVGVSRVIGLPNESVHYLEDVLYINEKAMDEPFLRSSENHLQTKGLMTKDFSLESAYHLSKLPRDTYLLVDDDILKKNATRAVHLVKKDKLNGVIKFTYYPLDKIRIITNDEFMKTK